MIALRVMVLSYPCSTIVDDTFSMRFHQRLSRGKTRKADWRCATKAVCRLVTRSVYRKACLAEPDDGMSPRNAGSLSFGNCNEVARQLQRTQLRIVVFPS
jgi:hypothetical protein